MDYPGPLAPNGEALCDGDARKMAREVLAAARIAQRTPPARTGTSRSAPSRSADANPWSAANGLLPLANPYADRLYVEHFLIVGVLLLAVAGAVLDVFG